MALATRTRLIAVKRLTLAVMLAGSMVSGSSAASLSEFFSASDEETPAIRAPIVTGEHAVKDLAYGDFLFDYFQNHYFTSLTKLLISEQKQTLSHNNAQAQTLKGALYTSFGMLSQAEQIFDELLPTAANQDDANHTWFTLAEMHYRRGNLERAHALLSEKIKQPSAALASQVKIRDAHILLALQRPDEAKKQLAEIKDGRSLDIWARYNLAAALASLDRPKEAAALFRSILLLPPRDEETEILRDRAAFALAMTYFRAKDWKSAQEYLDLVKLEGQVAEPALLAAGWLAINQHDKVGALTPWLHLAERPASHPAVQEALLNIPYVYEDAGALRDALSAYRHAENTLQQERSAIEQAKAQVLRADWIDRISPPTPLNSDPMGDLPGFALTVDEASPYLYRYFASHDFNEAYRSYRELQRLHQVLSQWQAQLPIFREMLMAHVERLQKNMPLTRQKMAMADTFRSHVLAREGAISDEVDRILETEDDFGTPDDEQLKLIARMKIVEQTLAGLPDDTYREAKARFQLLKGVLAWDLTNEGPQRRWQLVKQRAQLENELATLENTLATLSQARDTHLETLKARAESVRVLEQQLNALKDASIETLAQHRKYLQAVALSAMEQQQTRLDQLRGYSLLAIARLQDHAYSSQHKPLAPLLPAGILPEAITPEVLEAASAPVGAKLAKKREGPKSLMEAVQGWF